MSGWTSGEVVVSKFGCCGICVCSTAFPVLQQALGSDSAFAKTSSSRRPLAAIQLSVPQGLGGRFSGPGDAASRWAGEWPFIKKGAQNCSSTPSCRQALRMAVPAVARFHCERPLGKYPRPVPFLCCAPGRLRQGVQSQGGLLTLLVRGRPACNRCACCSTGSRPLPLSPTQCVQFLKLCGAAVRDACGRQGAAGPGAGAGGCGAPGLAHNHRPHRCKPAAGARLPLTCLPLGWPAWHAQHAVSFDICSAACNSVERWGHLSSLARPPCRSAA